MTIFDEIFRLSPSIRYVSIYADATVQMRQRGDLPNVSSPESDKYEELFINPVLLKLAKQRGIVDCGGARYVIVGYGHFHQLVIDRPNGHVSVCFDLGENPIVYVDRILSLL